MKLVPIKKGTAAPSALCEDVHRQTLAYYETIDYVEPWVSYYLQDTHEVVGICAFKGPPDAAQKIEIAYCTFEPFRGRGLGKAMCALLVQTAKSHGPVVISARTLPRTNASTAILQKNGFTCTGTILDPEDGEVWEWLLP